MSPSRIAACAACGTLLAAQQWVPINQAPSPRASFAMITDTVRDRVVMFGGAGTGGGALDDTWVYDGTYWTQLVTAADPPNRYGFNAAFDSARGTVVLAGGLEYTFGPTSGTYVLDGATWSLIHTANEPSPRTSPLMAFDAARGVTVLFGGWNTQGSSFLLDDTWEWDGTDWLARDPAHSPHPFFDRNMVYDAARQRVVLIESAAQRMWQWDGTDWTQIVTGSWPSPRNEARVIYRPDSQRLLLCGGTAYLTGTALPDTWEFDGFDWTELMTPTAPPTRSEFGMAWDPVGARPVVFGGRRTPAYSPLLGDTWVLAGNAWTNVPMPAEPNAVIGMAYDSHRDRFVAVTGNGPPTTWEFDGRWHLAPSGDAAAFLQHQPLVFDSWRNTTITLGNEPRTLEWTGDGWTHRPTLHLPPSRAEFALGFDPSRGVIVLFGGAQYSHVTFNDTWEFDGIDWAQRTPAFSPPVLLRAAMAYHAPTQRLVLFGGELKDSGGCSDRTWEYDGVIWTERLVAVRPLPRSGAALVADPATGHLLLAGGRGAQVFDLRRDTLRWDGSTWHATAVHDDIGSSNAQSAAADPHNAMMHDGNRWWRWSDQPAVTEPPSGHGCGMPVPQLVVGGRPFLGNPQLRLHVEPTLPDAIFALFADFTPATVALGNGCEQYLASPFLFCIGCATPTGHGQTTVAIPRLPALRGCVLHLQGLAGTPNGPLLGTAGLTARRTFVLGD